MQETGQFHLEKVWKAYPAHLGFPADRRAALQPLAGTTVALSQSAARVPAVQEASQPLYKPSVGQSLTAQLLTAKDAFGLAKAAQKKSADNSLVGESEIVAITLHRKAVHFILTATRALVSQSAARKRTAPDSAISQREVPARVVQGTGQLHLQFSAVQLPADRLLISVVSQCTTQQTSIAACTSVGTQNPPIKLDNVTFVKNASVYSCAVTCAESKHIKIATATNVKITKVACVKIATSTSIKTTKVAHTNTSVTARTSMGAERLGHICSMGVRQNLHTWWLDLSRNTSVQQQYCTVLLAPAFSVLQRLPTAFSGVRRACVSALFPLSNANAPCAGRLGRSRETNVPHKYCVAPLPMTFSAVWHAQMAFSAIVHACLALETQVDMPVLTVTRAAIKTARAAVKIAHATNLKIAKQKTASATHEPGATRPVVASCGCRNQSCTSPSAPSSLGSIGNVHAPAVHLALPRLRKGVHRLHCLVLSTIHIVGGRNQTATHDNRAHPHPPMTTPRRAATRPRQGRDKVAGQMGPRGLDVKEQATTRTRKQIPHKAP